MSERRNIVLTGFMGTGKTTIGRLLAARLGYDFVDTDELIEDRHGPIPQIFLEYGEDEFRRLERGVAVELADRRGVVISTGGRLMVDPVNAELLGAAGDVCCLTASVDTLVERLSAVDAETRPMLAGHHLPSRLRELLDARAPSYARFTQVSTDGRDPEEVALAVLDAVADRP